MHHQWLTANTSSLFASFIKSIPFLFKSRRDNLFTIERYFSNYFGRDVILLPSGRSAIHQYAHALGFARNKTAFVTKYSSFCMYQSLGSIMNVSTDYQKSDLLVINHKWGQVNIDPRAFKAEYVMEDSCDSLILDRSGLFPNNGQVEIMSLTKLIGTISGALIVFKDSTSVASNIAQSQSRNKLRGHVQFMRKLLRILFPSAFRLALQNEYANTYLTRIELAMIRNSLADYESNFNNNLDRYLRIYKVFNLFPSEFKRIGPGVVVAITNKPQSPTGLKIPKGVFIRNFDFSRSNDFQAAYERCLYVPIHKGISNATFDSFLSFMENNKNVLSLR